MTDIVEKLSYPKRSKVLIDLIKKRIVVLDGAMGTMIQQFGLEESDFHVHCECHKKHAESRQMKGCNDILVLSRPDVIEKLHRMYLDAGADIITTDTFNANAFSLADYNMSDAVTEINLAAARLSRKVAEEYEKEEGRTCFVAGSVGPTSKSLTMAANLGDSVTFDDFVSAYYDQCHALISGGVDILAFETFYDALNAKAAIFAARRAMVDLQVRIPVMISATLNQNGQTLSGMTLEAFMVTVSHANPIAIGINCGFGAEALAEHLSEIDNYTGGVVFYPNAGLPNELGEYEQTPEKMVEEIISTGAIHRVNIIGGCCGTTPAHISAIAKAVKSVSPRKISEPAASLQVAGLKALDFATRNFVNVGERCNVAGSRKFLRLIKEKNYDEAISVAENQIAKGADIIDINMDDGLLDAKECMSQFLIKIATEPKIATVPVMVDSSDFNVISEALKLIQGKPVVNSISLKEGEDVFISRARHIYEMGAAMVVMAFDETGQATTAERRIEVCSRAYRLLTDAGIPPCDIIFDPNILAVATGLEEHNNYAVDFISAAKWISENLPHVNISGGLSNLSFSFRGNDYVRNVMHSIFIDKARKAGMKMAIVNHAGLIRLDTIPCELSDAVIDVLDNKSSDATDRLVEIAPNYMAAKKAATAKTEAASTPDKHLSELLINGKTTGIEEDISALLRSGLTAIAIIEKVLMGAMNIVGERFGKGEMFLPQVVKSASVMKKAVEILTPEIEKNNSGRRGIQNTYKIVLATVKGDVHDIGKNIVAVVMRCNGFSVTDLGVMTPAEKIVDSAIEIGADAVGLSGLITPSLAEMVSVAQLMEKRGLKIPLFIGGATTSDLHTALKIATAYSAAVVHTGDAAQLAAEAKKYLDTLTAQSAFTDNYLRQEKLRSEYVMNEVKAMPLSEARAMRKVLSFKSEKFVPFSVTYGIRVKDIRSRINWRQYLAGWKLNPAEISKSENERSEVVKDLLSNANDLLDIMVKDDVKLTAKIEVLDACAAEDDIELTYGKETIVLPVLRQTSVLSYMPTLSLSDFVPQKDTGSTTPVCLFAVTVGAAVYSKYVHDSATYDGILADLLLSRLAEAATDYVHKEIISQHFESIGIRPAVGYPSLPDQSIVLLLDKVLKYEDMDVKLTENGAIFPSATITGLIFPHSDAQYFSLGELSEEQRNDYAHRRGFTSEQADKFLPSMKKYI